MPLFSGRSTKSDRAINSPPSLDGVAVSRRDLQYSLGSDSARRDLTAEVFWEAPDDIDGFEGDVDDLADRNPKLYEKYERMMDLENE